MPNIYIDLISRWIHIFAAIVIFGGTIFLRFVVHPSTESLPDAEREDVRGRLLQRWKKFIGPGIGLLLLSGFYNYWSSISKASADGATALAKPYHPLIGTKILISLAVFFLASVMVGRSPKFEGLRQNRKKWSTVLVVLASLVVLLAGAAKIFKF